jgi:hypothetical protein
MFTEQLYAIDVRRKCLIWKDCIIWARSTSSGLILWFVYQRIVSRIALAQNGTPRDCDHRKSTLRLRISALSRSIHERKASEYLEFRHDGSEASLPWRATLSSVALPANFIPPLLVVLHLAFEVVEFWRLGTFSA